LKSRSNSILDRKQSAEYNSPRIERFNWVAESRTCPCGGFPVFVLKGESSIIDIIIGFSEGVLKRRTEISLFIRGPTDRL
jgi:hypothetical protein